MSVQILHGDVRDVLSTLPADSFDCVVTSPPYWGLRDYGCAGQIGLEPTLAEYLETMTGVFRECRRVLKPEGTFWLNIGDSYCSTDKWGGGGNTGKQTVAADGSIPSWAVRQKKHKQPGLKPKDLCMVPNRLAIMLQDDGWYVRSEIIWHKPNPMPESITDRPTSAHEKVWLLTKSERYFYDADAIAEDAIYSGLTNQDASGFKNPMLFNGKHSEGFRSSKPDKQRGHSRRHAGFNERYAERIEREGAPTTRNARNVWSIATRPFKEAHFATMAPELAERCIKAGCPAGGVVLDPFGGSGTSGLVADRLGRNAVLIELNPEYVQIARQRIAGDAPLFAEVAP